MKLSSSDSEQGKTQAPKLKIVLVTGLSGAGKTLALKALEDLGYFCIDNLPCSLLDPLVMLFDRTPDVHKVALVMDGRDPTFFADSQGVIDKLRNDGYSVFLLFLDASNDVLLRRFAQTRRPHPLSRGGSVTEGVQAERERLAHLAHLASVVLDISQFNVHQLRKAVRDTIDRQAETSLTLLLLSFGFKHGIPLESSYVFDVRFLPNPFFVDDLRHLSGMDAAVAEYVMQGAEAVEMVDKIADMVTAVLPHCQLEGRPSLMCSVGCTGGQHRSVAIVEKVADKLRECGLQPLVVHRDLPKALQSTTPAQAETKPAGRAGRRKEKV